MLAYSQVKGNAPHAAATPQEIVGYLKDRGISITLAAELGLKILRAQDLMEAARGTTSSYPDDRYAIVFPHHSPLGFEIEWWSARLVPRTVDPRSGMRGPRLVHSFQEAVDPDAPTSHVKLGKMFCPPNTPPAAYLPHAPSLPAWDAIPRGSRVFFHESVIKAINGARLGHYSVGLNGVWGWSSRKHAIALLPEIRDIPWKALDLEPVILFDTNINTSFQVEEAAKRLAAKLLEITGRTAHILRMHSTPDLFGGMDYGFDDYAVAVGDGAARAFLDTPRDDLEEIDISEVELMKFALNSKVAIVRSMSRVADIESGALMTAGAFTELVYAHYQAQVALPDGNTKDVNVAKLWLKDERKLQVEDLMYSPGEPTIHVDSKGKSHLNTWRGMGVDPVQGHVDQWLELLSSNLADLELQEWVLDWLAWPLRHPGAKMNTLLLIFGPSGTGKDLFLRPMHTIYGNNAVKVSNDELKSTFTSLYAARQFIHADELKRTPSASDSVNQKIKGMVTNQMMTVNRKGDPEYKIKNVANLAITSNYYDCIKLDEDDRRAAIIRWSPVTESLDRRGMQDYWRPLAKWLESDAGAAAIYAYLLDRNLTGFDPAAWAPSTIWKEQVIDAARNPVERFAAQLKIEPELHLPPLCEGRVLFTAKELASFHYGVEPAKGQIDALANELRNQNFVRANRDKSIKTKHGVNRFWVIQRGDIPVQDWQDPSVCGKHLKAHGL
jgi:hypothetical protein